ncbi:MULTISPECIES: hypothetical protein [unclassified Sphingopyxis]|uniref:hypothetical protein n=1 Tax=unclassified Sphingopyxis TaxID=2614943 RepID=UPI0028572984|nr:MULTISPECIES: hypothetical protein [unclassified Sphingopyxis]MDR6833599.1 hypothetical protein [Sphingopyxis sp. BE122]MDR7225868.1 hypothetical protein [Sphingopyxis sp. BE259]
MKALKCIAVSITAASALFLTACESAVEREQTSEDAVHSTDEVTETAADVSARASNLTGETSVQRTDRLREQAKTDPVGADAAAIDNMSGSDVVATAINSAGYLCAKVTQMYPSRGAIIVHCVEYRNGSGRVKYRVDAQAATVEPM